MKIFKCLLVTAALFFPHHVFAQHNALPRTGEVPQIFQVQPATDLYEQKNEGLVYLFDGKTLDGWTNVIKFGPPYYVTNGVIACPANAGNDLVTERAFSDFILRMDFKLTPGANNGVGIRTPLETANLTYVGNEIQILDDDDAQYAHLEPGQYCGSLYKIFAAKRGALKKTGEWNHYEITVIGRHFKIDLNDQTIVDANLNDVTDPETLREHPGMLRDRGHIALLGHSSYVEFRNISIKDLSRGVAAIAPAEVAAELFDSPGRYYVDRLPDNKPPQGFKALFDGHDLSGWKGLGPIPPNAPPCLPGSWPPPKSRPINGCASIGKSTAVLLYLTVRGTIFARRKITAISKCWWIGKFRPKATAAFTCAALRRCRSGRRTARDSSRLRMAPAACGTTRRTHVIR